jgi:hypothetical protein
VTDVAMVCRPYPGQSEGLLLAPSRLTSENCRLSLMYRFQTGTTAAHRDRNPSCETDEARPEGEHSQPRWLTAEGRALPIASRLRRLNVPVRSGAPAGFRGYFSIEE